MRRDLDDALCRDFPLLYRDRYASMATTCMCWGFDVGNGWEPIIRRLSEKLEPLCQRYKALKAVQVKSKFGTLRFYTNLYIPEIGKYIAEACEEASRTCEWCGALSEVSDENISEAEEGYSYACDYDVKCRKCRES